MTKADYADCLNSLAADIVACGSDHLKLDDLVKRMRDRAADLINNDKSPWAFDRVQLPGNFVANIPPKDKPPRADEKDKTSVDLTPKKKASK